MNFLSLQHFGEITKNVLDQSIPSLIVSFAVRAHAEQAMQRGRIFKEKPLQVGFVCFLNFNRSYPRGTSKTLLFPDELVHPELCQAAQAGRR